MPRIKKKVSMAVIAERMGISKNAVSLALSNKAGVSEELRAAVRKTAQELGYTHNPNGGGAEKSRNILVLIPEYISADTFFYNDIYWSIEKESKTQGYTAIPTSVSAEAEGALEAPPILGQLDFCGIILVGIFRTAYVRRLLEAGLPVLSVDQYYDDLPVDAVVTANVQGAYTVVQHLIGQGHRSIGFVGSIGMTASLYDRWCGFRKAMEHNGLPVDPSLCILDSTELGDLMSDPDEMASFLDRMQTFPTAWFCGGDRIAITLIQALVRRGLRVPEDISVAGFDDIQASRVIAPALTTYHVRRELMGATAVDYLVHDLLRCPDERMIISLYGDLIPRDSVRTLG